jgi:hypothetical protein
MFACQVGDAKHGWSDVFNFKSQVDPTTLAAHLPQLHVIFGDMGSADAFTLCSTCSGKSTVCDKKTCSTANQSTVRSIHSHPILCFLFF